MALYEVTRTDMENVKPGEFINALVIAGGVGQARRAVLHLDGVTRSNVRAEKRPQVGDTTLLTVYFDERDVDLSFLFDVNDNTEGGEARG